MSDQRRGSNIATVTLAAVFAVTAGAVQAAESEEQAVRQALDGFYASLNAMFTGDAKPVQQVWSHAADVTFMGADGQYNVGWKQTYANWQQQASLKIGGRVRPTNVNITVGEKLAVASNYVEGVNQLGGTATPIKLRVTSAFRKENGTWKMISHHVDVLPTLRERENQ